MEGALLGEDALEVLRGILEHSRLPITVATLDGKLELFNRAAEELSGYKRTDVLGKPVEELFVNRARVARVLREVLEKGSLERVEGTLKRSDGTLLPIAMNLTVLHDLMGRPAGVLCVTQDMSARRRMEAQLQRMREEAEFYVDLMCHDLRNMDQTILGYLEFLLDGGAGVLPDTVRGRVLEAWREAYLFREFLRLVQVMAGRETDEEVHLSGVSLGWAAREAVERVSERMGSSVSWELRIRSEPMVKAPELLPDMIGGLLSYAVAHVEPDKPIGVSVARRRGMGWLGIEFASRARLRRNLLEWRYLAELNETEASAALSAMMARVCGGTVRISKRRGLWRMTMRLPLWPERPGGDEEV